MAFPLGNDPLQLRIFYIHISQVYWWVIQKKKYIELWVSKNRRLTFRSVSPFCSKTHGRQQLVFPSCGDVFGVKCRCLGFSRRSKATLGNLYDHTLVDLDGWFNLCYIWGHIYIHIYILIYLYIYILYIYAYHLKQTYFTCQPIFGHLRPASAMVRNCQRWWPARAKPLQPDALQGWLIG